MNNSDGSKNYSLVYRKELRKIESRIAKLFLKRKPGSLYEPCSYVISSGGKRLRPFLVLISAKAVNGSFSKVYNAALAVELLHNFTLVHDDIMDNSDKRRGRLTAHKKYDVNTAILAGDNLIALAYEMLLKDCDDNSKNVVSTFTRAVIEVCEGQSLDKDFELRKSVGIKEYKEMIYKKTAALAEMCCSIGAQLGGGNNTEIKALENFGKNLGMAFQIQDDLLDITADEKKLGKPVGGDLLEGKKTYLFLRALEKSKGNDKKLLQAVIKNKGIKKEEIKIYKDLYERLNILTDAKKEIIHYTDSAIKELNKLPNEEGKALLNWLANSLIDRNK
ncbi:MAG: polyprenyl synthetase family protein [Ignavibacteriales bacterium]|nr:polyprenyl synthetase family protein [Ignavibacteriales bacterium]